jgi:hypothetical protein
MNPFDYLKAINMTKQNVMVGSDNDEFTEKEYKPFIVNRGLSYFQDTVYQANEMNRYHHLPNKLQFEFLLNIVRKRKRFSKWFKKEADSDLELVKEYYGYNDQKAKQALSILSRYEIECIKGKMEKGGKK